MRSQRPFENNTVQCECSEAAFFDTGVRKAAFDVGGLLLPREVFWKRILAKSCSLRWCGCLCERMHRIMRREMRLWIACVDGKRSSNTSLRFLNRTRQNAEIQRSVLKQTKAHRSVATLIESGVAAALAIWKGSNTHPHIDSFPRYLMHYHQTVNIFLYFARKNYCSEIF